ncbi:ABC transporter ATP-binding protein [Falsiroseomonas sp. CW058]|uniref:ABC transporter ATP-binding protein n=1 Tax=Falsiroseomonas sp. CW058 TaxID=3388664 RepID=UPI003D31E4BA
MTLLEVEGLAAGYGPAQVLFGIDLALAPGEVLALLGRNGAGKSTTLKAIIGLVPPRGGRVRLRGAEVTGWPAHRIARAGLGYVPEDRRIFPDLTVAENLEVGRRPPRDGRPPWTFERLAGLFPNLAAMRTRRGEAMSGGEQQMLTIARTLMGNPDAVLLDEPSEGLAPVIVEQMAEAVLRMKAEGIAVLLAEQSLDFAAAVADRALVLERGAMRWSGPMADLGEDGALRSRLLAV